MGADVTVPFDHFEKEPSMSLFIDCKQRAGILQRSKIGDRI
jgi:hypothetical protein